MNTNSVETGTGASPTLPWFALKVRDRSEQIAMSGLLHKGYNPFAPTYMTRRVYRDRVKTFDAPVFPGYVFCQFDPVQKFVVLNSPAVNYIVQFGNVMTPVSANEIEAIRRAVAAGAKPVAYLTVGQRVRIARGSLAGLEGVLLRAEGGPRVVISVVMLQRSIAVNIDSDLLIGL
jgi:transcription antitermination factor NusG